MTELPFPHVVLDGFASTEEIAAADADWPAPDWPGWMHYTGERGQKAASDLLTPLPLPCSRLLARMAGANLGAALGMPASVADLSLHGGGLHEIGPGGNLPTHLDADGHARLGLLRAWSAVLFAHPDWEPEWGGELYFCDRHGNPVASYAPLPGRLVAFDCRGDAYHGVLPVRCPATVGGTACSRRSLALLGYLPEPAGGLRARAVFGVPLR